MNNYPNNEQFYYTLSFNLANPNGADIKGQGMTDNGSDGAGLISQILVDGQPTGQVMGYSSDQYEPFNTWNSFELNGGYFQAGINTITFSVTNWPQDYGNPTGLRVAFTSGGRAARTRAQSDARALHVGSRRGGVRRRHSARQGESRRALRAV